MKISRMARRSFSEPWGKHPDSKGLIGNQHKVGGDYARRAAWVNKYKNRFDFTHYLESTDREYVMAGKNTIEKTRR